MLCRPPVSTRGPAKSSRMEVRVGLGGVVITLLVVTSLCCVIWVNDNAVKGQVGRGPVSVAHTMAEHRPLAPLGNPSQTPPTLHGHAFMGRRAVTERKGNKRENPGKKFVRNNENSTTEKYRLGAFVGCKQFQYSPYIAASEGITFSRVQRLLLE